MSFITIKHSPTGERVLGSSKPPLSSSSSSSIWLRLDAHITDCGAVDESLSSLKQTKEKQAKRSNYLVTTTTTATSTSRDDARFLSLLARSALSFERSLISSSRSSTRHWNNNNHKSYNNNYQVNNNASSRILACSARIDQYRPLCEDRKGVIDHLYPKRIFKSTVRVVVEKGAQTLMHYLTDQLKADIARDELVLRGKLTREIADLEADEWVEQEWEKRTDAFPQKVKVALLKYHSVILFMRFYEYLASLICDMVVLDKLTTDTFEHAKRSSAKGKVRTELASDIFHTSMKANLFSYLADYSVDQVILCFGYYMYVQSRRKKREGKTIPSPSTPTKTTNDNDDATAGPLHMGSLMLSFSKNSALLAISRAFCLLLSSFGGAVGSIVLPGWAAWGWHLGSNAGNHVAMVISDEFIKESEFVV